ncbi:LysR family transcriptional regulator, partial [Escherichia coli]|nr:LysR family transcriptional regulator [Escherichia coli]
IRSVEKRFPMSYELKFSYRTDNNLAQLAAIRSGIGIGICQDSLGQANPDLVCLLPGAFSIMLPTWIAMHENLRSSHRFRLIFDTLIRGMLAHIELASSRKMQGPPGVLTS